MIRFVKAPDNSLVPDIAEKLPGRGVWVLADRSSLEQAISNGGFKRGLKSNVKVDAQVMDLHLFGKPCELSANSQGIIINIRNATANHFVNISFKELLALVSRVIKDV